MSAPRLSDEDLAIQIQMRFRHWSPSIQHYKVHGDLFDAGTGLLARFPLPDVGVDVVVDEECSSELNHLLGWQGKVVSITGDYAWVEFQDRPEPETVPLIALRSVEVTMADEPAVLPMEEQA